MSKIVWKGGALLAPTPLSMVTCGTMEKPNVLTVAWTGIINTAPPKTYISVRPCRYSYPMIRESGEFVVNLTTAEMIRAADWCGVHTGAKVDKFARCNLHTEAASQVAAPLLSESPLALECRVTESRLLGTHELFLAEILGVDVDEQYLDSKGGLNLQQWGLAAYAHGEYFALGRKLGDFGFSVRKRKRSSDRMSK